MKQIKTVYKDINPRLSPTQEVQEFDDEVNAALNEGWTLVKRGVLDPHVGESYDYHRTFYAELERKEQEETEEDCLLCKHFDKADGEEPCSVCCHGVPSYSSKWEPEA
jgi:hypothetical protein